MIPFTLGSPLTLTSFMRAQKSIQRYLISRGNTTSAFSESHRAMYAIGSPKLHPCSCEALAFLSESSNLMITTERYLKHWSDPVGSEARKKYPGVHCDSTL